MQSLIPPEIRPAIKHADHLSRRGCSDGSDSFANYSYIALRNATMLPDEMTFDDFSPCDYLPQLQQVLFSTDELAESVTYETFVIVPESLNTTLREQFGEDTDINGPFVSLLSRCLLMHVTVPHPCLLPHHFTTAVASLWIFVPSSLLQIL